MIVVGSSAEHIKSSWVEAEWLFFLNRKRSGKTSGNLFTVATKSLKLDEIPPSLANYEVIPYNEKNFPIIYNYVREPNTPAKPAPKKPFSAGGQNKYLLAVISVLLVGILSASIHFSSQPYDATIFLKPNPNLNLHSSYPPFEGGEISVLIDDKEEPKQILRNGEVVFKKLESSSKGQKVSIKLNSKYWKTELDSIELDKVLNLNIIPDGSLGKITGNVKNSAGFNIGNVLMKIDNDTTITSNNDGSLTLLYLSSFKKSFMCCNS